MTAASRPDCQQLLDAGLELLAAQRDAMLAGDGEQLTRTNARLGEWLASYPRNAGRSAGALGGGERGNLARALRENAVLASQAHARATRALGALLPAADGVYSADGRTSTRPPRRSPFSA